MISFPLLAVAYFLYVMFVSFLSNGMVMRLADRMAFRYWCSNIDVLVFPFANVCFFPPSFLLFNKYFDIYQVY